jgi:hypothetical protein
MEVLGVVVAAVKSKAVTKSGICFQCRASRKSLLFSFTAIPIMAIPNERQTLAK